MKREVKIGIFAVAMIGVAWAGIRFLKGFDIFSRNVEYYAAYDQINGVQNASPIMMKGVKIGSVTRLSFDPARSDKVVLQFTIKRQYRIPSDSEAKIFSNGLMGAKAIEITYGTADTYLQKGDTLRSSRDRDLMDMAGSELDFFKQKVSQLTTDLSRTLENLNGLMETNADNIAGTLGNLNSVTGDMAEILSAEKNSLKSALDNLSKFSDMLGENAGRVDSIIGDVDRFTSQLTEEQFARKLSQAVEHLDGLVARIAQGEGTVGKLISDPELYDSLEKASDNLAALLADVKQYPGRYVHLSLFGRNPEKMKERADRKAAKAAANAGKSAEGSVQVGMNFQKMMENMKYAAAENAAVFGTPQPKIFVSERTPEGDLLVLRAHAAAREAIKTICPEVKVGLTLSLHDLQAQPGGEAFAAAAWEEEFTHYLPYIKEDDFLGVQNYTRTLYGAHGQLPAPQGAELTQMDYEFYPQALENVIRKVAQDFHGDLIVTENGIATADDTRRVAFIEAALAGVQNCIADGIPVKGYFHWSLMDNFEWQKGYAMNFGLIAVNRETMGRTPKPSLAALGGYANA